MSVTPMTATFAVVQDDAGSQIRQRRENLGVSVTDLAVRAGLDRGVVYRVEAGRSVRPTSVRVIERALDELEREHGMDVPSVVRTVGDPDDGMVEFTVEGHFGVRAVVKGPIRDIDKLQEAVARLMAGMDRPTE